MGFVIWHYVGRIGAPVLFALAACAMIAREQSLLHTVGLWAFCVLFLLGMTGAVLALLLFFTRFRFSCPHCRSNRTEFGGSKKEGMWLHCSDCKVVTRESGFLRLRLSQQAEGSAAR